MRKTMEGYIKSLNDEDLYKLFGRVIDELNKRKTAQMRKIANIDFEKVEVC